MIQKRLVFSFLRASFLADIKHTTTYNVHSNYQGVRIDVDEDTAAAAAASGIFRSSATTSGGKSSQQQEKQQQSHSSGVGGGNRVANPSIGELSLGASLSMGSGSHLDRWEVKLTLINLLEATLFFKTCFS